MDALPHPETEEIELTAVLDALSDPTRLSVVRQIEESADKELNCGALYNLGSKTNMAYHLAKLREAGVSRTRTQGTLRFISLRKSDLDRRFPGLLDAIVSAAKPVSGRRKVKTAKKRSGRS